MGADGKRISEKSSPFSVKYKARSSACEDGVGGIRGLRKEVKI